MNSYKRPIRVFFTAMLVLFFNLGCGKKRERTIYVPVPPTPGFTVGSISGSTSEGGGTATFTVVLKTDPTDNVVVNLTSSDTTEGTVSPATLTFTSAQWNVAQTVTVTGVDDALVDGDVSYSIALAVDSSSASAYRDLTISSVAVTNLDNDVNFSQQAYVKASNGEANDEFGLSLAASGDTLVVTTTSESSNQTTITNGSGASSDNSANAAGAAYVYKRTGTSWAQEAYLKAANAEANDVFGTSSAISGDTIVIGATGESSNQTTITNGSGASSDNSESTAGAAYVYKRTGTTWVQEAYLKAANAESSDLYGKSVSISGDTIVVGAYSEDSNQTTITNGTSASSDNSATDAGAVYVYKRTGSSWAQEAYLKAANTEASDFFGYSVGISGDTIVVGATGEDSNQTTITNGTTASSNNGATDAGAAYVYKRSGSTWVQEAYLKASNAEAGDDYGYSVAISGDTIVVGADLEDSSQTTITNGTGSSSVNGSTSSGAAYVYKRTGSTWAQEAYLKASNSNANDSFGYTVSISGDLIVVGAYNESSSQTTITLGPSSSSNNSASSAGAAYVYKRIGTNWAQIAYLKASNGEASDLFGYSVAVSGTTVAVSAIDESSNQTSITNGSTSSSNNSASASGAAYIISP